MNSRAFTDEDTIPSSDEENIFRAATGLPFRCGLCGDQHHPSKIEGAVKRCLTRLVMETGPYPTTAWSPYDGEIKTLVLRMGFINPDLDIWPVNKLFDLMHPSLVKEYMHLRTLVSDRLSVIQTREFPLMEALAASDPKTYLTGCVERFYSEVSRDDRHREKDLIMRPLASKLSNWRSIPPEKFEIKNVTTRKSENGECEWIEYLFLNECCLSGFDIIQQFPKEHALESAFWHADPNGGCNDEVLYDIALLDGIPTISWGLRWKRFTRRGLSEPEWDLRLLTLWTGRNFLNLSGKHKLQDLSNEEGAVIQRLIREKKIVELAPV